jgi:predicted NBD/HSP70 family sugar kinase
MSSSLPPRFDVEGGLGRIAKLTIDCCTYISRNFVQKWSNIERNGMTSTPERHSPHTIVILDALRSGRANSRADLAKATGLSPSTVSARVDELIKHGHVLETGEGESRGGRRPRRLDIRADAGVVGCIDLGVDRASLGLVDFSGTLIAERHVAMDIALGPRVVLESAVGILREQLAEVDLPPASTLRGLSVGVPGPVAAGGARIVSPSRMPGWNGISVPDVLAGLIDVPVVVNNDANLMAVGEFVSGDPRFVNQVFVKAGSGIGCGIIAGGTLYTGSHGAAGDISHVSVPGAPDVPCSCGKRGCLDAVASGNALVRQLQDHDVDVSNVEAMIELSKDAHPLATRLLREAGSMTGGVLATIVNYSNPDRLVLGGVLSQSEVFVASVRSTLYAECLPMATEHLAVAVSALPLTGGLVGAGKVFLDREFSVAGV